MLAEDCDKQHDKVVRDIRRLLERNINLNGLFRESTYTNRRGKTYSNFILTDEGKDLMINKYRLRSVSASLERPFGEWLTCFFPNEQIEKQYRVLDYRIDFYMKDLGICIEYDEKEHKYQKEKDAKRQRLIQEELKRDYLENIEYDVVVLRRSAGESFPFFRVEEGKEVQGMKDLLLLIRDRTMSDVCNYMN